MDVVAKPKRWGNSMGVIIPNEIVKTNKITLRDELIIHIEKKSVKERRALMKEGYVEMKEELKKVNKEWEKIDYEE
ncbi:MAG: hypothetical protein HY515_03015 [Candidatus Aenigmarchaeota archaeon]|nr:hypothetical protein [Candidatus Aenigmarchaeota archaeon]